MNEEQKITPSKDKKGDLLDAMQKFRFEIVWPVASLLAFLRPLHYYILDKVVNIEEKDRVLELGSGVLPLYDMYASKIGRGGIFVALDYRLGVQKKANRIGFLLEKIPFFNKSKSKRIVGDATKLPFPDELFDKIVMSNLPNDATDEIERVLKDGGILVSAFNEPFSIPVVSLLIKRELKKKGFADIELFPISPGFIIPGVFTNWCIVATKPNKNSHFSINK